MTRTKNPSRLAAVFAALSAAIVLTPVGVVGSAAPAVPEPDGRPTRAPVPLIGANYTHFAGGCVARESGLSYVGIIANWGRPGIPQLVRRQLVRMRASRLNALRVIVWHQTNARGQIWGVISSAGGRPSGKDTKSLRDYFQAVRQAGFSQLLVSFAPASTNNPLEVGYNPSKLEENWRFMTNVRSLAKQYGPPSIHIDLLNEATPDPSDEAAVARIKDYVVEIYRRYVQAYGNRDESVSAIASQSATDVRQRLQNLIDALRASGVELPRWFDVHIGGRAAAENLEAVERTLRRNGLGQPLVISEVPYEDEATASSIASYVSQVPRWVPGVLEWPRTRGSPCGHISVSPPYTANAYLSALAPTAD